MSLFTGLGFSSFINGKAKALGGIYAKAYGDLIKEMNDFSNTSYSRDRAAAMLARVDDVASQLQGQTKNFVQKEVPATYFVTAGAVKKDIKKLNIKVPEAFGQIHFQATEAMASDAMLKFGHTMTGIKRSAEDVAKFAQQKAVREILGAGQLKGEAADTLRKEVQAKIEQDGIYALIDKGGKKWQLDTYAEMLTRQMLANSGREGVTNTAREFGLDLAIVTVHGTECPLCKPWEGEVISLTGDTPGYKTLDEAVEAGLLHVGCKHGYTITSGIGRNIPADYKASILSSSHPGSIQIGALIPGAGAEVPIPDRQTFETLQAMKYEGSSDKKIEYITTAEGTKMPIKFGDVHRWVDDQEFQSIIDTGELRPTPANPDLGGRYYGRPDHKDFDTSPDGSGGKMFLETLQVTSTYQGSGMHHIILNIEDIPKDVEVHTDRNTVGSLSLKGSIPMKNLSLVESIGSKIFPAAKIDWKDADFEAAKGATHAASQRIIDNVK